jgi:hypothetical protein
MRFLKGFGWGFGLGIVALVGALLYVFVTGNAVEVPFLISGGGGAAAGPGADVQVEPLGLLALGLVGGLLGLVIPARRPAVAP